MITYKVVKCRNPKNPDADYFKGTAVKSGELTMEKLAKRINDSTTVTTADCYAVLKSMKQHIVEALHEGQVVVLEDIGRFQLSLQGKCYPEDMLTNPDFKPSEMIKGWKVIFRPDPRLKSEVRKEIKLKRISSEALA
jgi:predicted histone-like DNA-binding protein